MNLRLKIFCSDVKTICNYPERYTLNGTFGEAIAKIESSALRSKVFNVAGHHGLHPFQKWLSTDIRFPDPVNFTSFKQFRENFPDDKTALKELSKLVTEFCKSLPNEEDKIDIRLKESDAHVLYNVLDKILNKTLSISFSIEEKQSLVVIDNLLKNELELQPLRRKLHENL